MYEGVVVHPTPPTRRAQLLATAGDASSSDWGTMGHLDHLRPLMSTQAASALAAARRPLPGRLPGPSTVAVRDAVEVRDKATGPREPIFLLAEPRTWGWCFNPLSTFYCCDVGGEVRAVVLEVTNTPWHERHAYVLDARKGLGQGFVMAKALHVSPFMAMAHAVPPAPRTSRASISRMGISVSDDEGVVFTAGMSLRRRPLTRAEAGEEPARAPAAQPPDLGIHLHGGAPVLWRRGAPLQQPPPEGRGRSERPQRRPGRAVANASARAGAWQDVCRTLPPWQARRPAAPRRNRPRSRRRRRHARPSGRPRPRRRGSRPPWPSELPGSSLTPHRRSVTIGRMPSVFTPHHRR